MGAFGRIYQALPALIGVVLAVLLYRRGGLILYLAVVFLLIALIGRTLALAQMHRAPKFARKAVELWILAPIALSILTSFGLLWLGAHFSAAWLVDTGGLGQAEVKALSDVVVGAVAAFLGILWTKDIGDGTGFFWPSTLFKAAIGAAYQKLDPAPGGGSNVYRAAYMEAVDGYGPLGWNFRARTVRAQILEDWVKAHPEPAPDAEDLPPPPEESGGGA